MNKKKEIVKDNPKEVKSQLENEMDAHKKAFLSDTDDSINLIPIMTKSEVIAEEKKVKLNVAAILSIIVFLVITIGVVGYTTISKNRLNKAKERLQRTEQEVKGLSSKILSNDEILKRIYLYKDISSNQYSAKKMFDYFTKIASFDYRIQLDSFVFQSDKSISFEGTAPSLDTTAKFWYLLGEDEKVVSVKLDSMSKRNQDVQFVFDITLVSDAFSIEGTRTVDEGGDYIIDYIEN